MTDSCKRLLFASTARPHIHISDTARMVFRSVSPCCWPHLQSFCAAFGAFGQDGVLGQSPTRGGSLLRGLATSFRGASEASEPGIHNPCADLRMLRSMDSGFALKRAPECRRGETGDRSKPHAIPAPIPQNKVRALQINSLANLSPRTFPRLIMRPGRSNRGRFASVMKRDWRAVAAHGCQDAHPTRGGPSRTVPAPRVGVTSLFGGDAVTPRQAARCRRGSQRWLANSDHRGTCGANLKHRARDAGEKADLRKTKYRDAGPGRGRHLLRAREGPEPVGPLDPRRPARPRTFPKALRPHDPGGNPAAETRRLV